MVVDCRSLIEFCRAFHHRHRSPTTTTKRSKFPVPFCNHSPFAAVDVVLLLLVLTSLAVLTLPFLSLILRSSAALLSRTPAALLLPLLFLLPLLAAAWHIAAHHSRKCGSPYCKGLRKAVEFDIQLESEDCVRYLLPVPKDLFGVRPLELVEDYKELEAELRKMAPPNGRTVLIFRARCGCPTGRMEVWGPKKVRRIKK